MLFVNATREETRPRRRRARRAAIGRRSRHRAQRRTRRQIGGRGRNARPRHRPSLGSGTWTSPMSGRGVAEQPVMMRRRNPRARHRSSTPPTARRPSGSWRTPLELGQAADVDELVRGFARRSFINGRRLIPPAITFVPGVPTRPSASSSEARPLVVERVGDHARAPFAVCIARQHGLGPVYGHVEVADAEGRPGASFTAVGHGSPSRRSRQLRRRPLTPSGVDRRRG